MIYGKFGGFLGRKVKSLSIIAVVAIIAVVFVSTNEEIEQSKIVTTVDSEQLTIDPTTLELQPHKITITPQTSPSAVTEETKSNYFGTQLVFPFFKNSYAIGSTATDVTYDKFELGDLGLHAISFVSIDTSQAIVSNDLAYFSKTSQDKIARIDPNPSDPDNPILTEWNLPTGGGEPFGFVVNGSGYVFFTERVGNKIGMLNPFTNEITEWEVPVFAGASQNPEPRGIDIDSNNVLYFAQHNTGFLGSLNPDTNEFKTWKINPTLPFNKPFGIAVDKDNNVWATDLNPQGAVFRLNPISNEVTMWVNGILGVLVCIDTDSDGNVYFGEFGQSNIDRLDPVTNTVTRWAIPNVGDFPICVAVSEHGGEVSVFSVLDDNPNSGAVRVVPETNTVTEWAISPMRGNGIAIGSGGEVWFTSDEPADNYFVGRLSQLP